MYIFILALAGVIVFLLILKRIKTAKLISENLILSITPIEAGRQSVSVIISCFGILIGGKAYKFNCDAIRLIKVDININEMILRFGNEEKQREIKVLHGLYDKSEVSRIAEKFRYETGVIPSVSNW